MRTKQAASHDRLALARHLVGAMDLAGAFDHQVLGPVQKVLKKMEFPPGLVANSVRAVADRVRPSSRALAARWARLYATKFSADDLRGLIRFYESSLGRRVLATRTQLVARALPAAIGLIKERWRAAAALPMPPKAEGRPTQAGNTLLAALSRAARSSAAVRVHSRRTLALAGRLLSAMGYPQAFMQRQAAAWRRHRKQNRRFGAADARRNAASPLLPPEAMKPHLMGAYAAVLDDSELRELIRFYESDLGKHLVAAQTEMLSEI